MVSLIFFGTGPVAAESLKYLADKFVVKAVVTKQRASHHTGRAHVEELASERGLPTLFANNKQQLDALIHKETFSSSLGVVVDYGVIISKEAIDSFAMGIVNSHFSLLPRWRGADPISFAILEGDEKTGVSLMLIEPTLDTGKLIAQKSLAITSEDTTPSLTDRLIGLSNEMLGTYLPKYVNGEITPRSQPHPNRATFSRKLTKDDGVIDWSKSASRLEREIRAFAGWPKSRTQLEGREVIVTKAHVAAYESHAADAIGKVFITPDNLIGVASGEGVLVIEQLKPAGKKEMDAKAFINGYLN